LQQIASGIDHVNALQPKNFLRTSISPLAAAEQDTV
jgi:hypothetical protein